MKMLTLMSLVILASMTVPTLARLFPLTVTHQYGYGEPVYVVLPWEVCGLPSNPGSIPLYWRNGWNVGNIYTITPGNTTVITLNFVLSSKSSHVLHVSKTYLGAQNNDNSIPCSGLPITINTVYPSFIQMYASQVQGNNFAYCGVLNIQ